MVIMQCKMRNGVEVCQNEEFNDKMTDDDETNLPGMMEKMSGFSDHGQPVSRDELLSHGTVSKCNF